VSDVACGELGCLLEHGERLREKAEGEMYVVRFKSVGRVGLVLDGTEREYMAAGTLWLQAPKLTQRAPIRKLKVPPNTSPSSILTHEGEKKYRII
jgi:hypothetical protein